MPTLPGARRLHHRRLGRSERTRGLRPPAPPVAWLTTPTKEPIWERRDQQGRLVRWSRPGPDVRRASGSAAGSASSGARTSVGQGRARGGAGHRGPAAGPAQRRVVAARWLSKTGEWADRLNSLPKYVVSSTLQEPKWSNSTVLRGNVVSEVSKLKQELDGEIVVYASYQLGRTLIERDLVDELRLFIYPVLLGSASGCSARPATRNPCASSTPRRSVTASSSSPTRSSGTPSGRRTAPAYRKGPAARPPPGGRPVSES